MTILETNQLNKHYGRIQAVSDLSLSVAEGNIFGILGPNGSGKTTTLGIVLGITLPDSGTYQWFEGKYGDNARRHIGALLETPNFYPYLNAAENLAIVAHIKKVSHPPIDELLDMVNLLSRKTSDFRTYSLGMKQRLAIAATMIGDPDILIFDEPTNGLDPLGIAEVRDTLLQIAQRGKTILMASHILDEVEKICSHVAIIKNGKLLVTGTVGSILSNEVTVEVAAENMGLLKDMLSGSQMVSSIELKKDKLMVHLKDPFTAIDLNKLAFEKGIVLSFLATRKKRLEEEFLEITNRV